MVAIAILFMSLFSCKGFKNEEAVFVRAEKPIKSSMVKDSSIKKSATKKKSIKKQLVQRSSVGDVISPFMRVHFENPVEGTDVVSYIIQKNYGWRWSTVITIPANKRPSIYDTAILAGSGNYRIKTNKISGATYSKNVYVAKN